MRSRIVGWAAAAALSFTWNGPLRAEDGNARRLPCNALCQAWMGPTPEAARPRDGAAAGAGRRVTAATSPAPAQARPPGGDAGQDGQAAPTFPSAAEAPKRPRPAVEHARAPDAKPHPAPQDAAAPRGGVTRTEANTEEPLPHERGILIPTVHIGVLPKSEHPSRAGTPGFDVPGESGADAERRKVLMHICVTC